MSAATFMLAVLGMEVNWIERTLYVANECFWLFFV